MLSFSSPSCPDKNAKKFLVRFRLSRSRRGENLMELMWNELCTTVGRTTTKVNAHFVPRFFSCLQAVNTHRVRLLARMLVPPQDFPFLASWGTVIKNIWRSKRCNVEHNTNSADKIFCVKEIAAVYIHVQIFSKFLVFCPSNDNSVITLRRIFAPELQTSAYFKLS